MNFTTNQNKMINKRFIELSLIFCCLLIVLAILHQEFLLVPDWIRMWLVAVTVYGTCKLLTFFRITQTADSKLTFNYLFLEPGLNAKRFYSDSNEPSLPTRLEWLKGIGFIIAGLLCVWIISPMILATSQTLAAVVGMTGVVFILHFGLLDLLSAWQRRSGFHSTALMNDPWRAVSVADFWTRWNTGFRDFSREMIFYPLVKRKQAHLGLWLTFLFSGLVHDLVISLPARAGYGGPTIYFLIQALAIDLERSQFGKRCFLSSNWYRTLWAGVVILGPAALLFHQPFRENIVLPMLIDLGAI